MAGAMRWVRDPLTRMELELEQWGRWVRSGVGVSGFGAQLGGLRGSTVPTPQISDERALAIDQAMLRLRSYDLALWTALWCTFVEGMKPYRWAARAGVSRTVAYTTTLPNALRWMFTEVAAGEE